MSPRFSLKQLLILVAFAAVASAALARPSYWWHATIVTAVVCLAIGMVIAALVANSRSRAFAAGWLVLAIGYLATVFGPWTATNVAPSLLTTKGLARLEARWHRDQPSPQLFVPVITDYDSDGDLDLWMDYPHVIYGQPAGGSGTVLWNVNSGRQVSKAAPQLASNYSVFQATAHWLVAVMLGHLGGWLAAILAWRQWQGSKQS